MKAGKCDAYFGVNSPPAIRRKKYHMWRFEWVLRGQCQFAMVEPLFKNGVLWSSQCKVPFKQIIFRWSSSKIWCIIILQLPNF